MSNQSIQLSQAAIQSLTLWTAADIAHVKEMIAPDANEQEFRMLLYMANEYKLDPLLKQIWCVKYGTKPAQIFAGRDGFLAIAHRTGAFDGLETTVRIEQVPFDVTYKDYGVVKHHTREFQYVATSRAYIKSARHPVTVEVWEEEYSTGQNLWATKPRTMITKVAECQAVRKAFNISGLYDPAEMGNQADTAIEGTYQEVPATPSDRATAPQSLAAAQSTPQAADPPQRHASAQPATGAAPPTGDVAGAWKDYRYLAPQAGYTTEDAQKAHIQELYPGRKPKDLTLAEVQALSADCRRILDLPATDGSEAAA